MLDRGVERVDHADRQLHVEELGVPVGIASPRRPRRSPAAARPRSSPPSSTPASAGREARGQEALGDAAWTSRVSAALQTPGPLDLGVDGDPPRHLGVGVGVDVDVAVAGRRVHHRHRRDRLQRLLGPRRRAGSAGRPALLRWPARRARRGRRRRAAGPRPRAGRPRRAPRARRAQARRWSAPRSCEPRRTIALPLLIVSAAQSMVTFGPRLVDDRDDAERDPQLAQVEAARERRAARAPRRSGRASAATARKPVGHRLDPLRGQREAVAQGLGEPRGALIGEVGGVRLEDLRRRALRAARRSPRAPRSWSRSTRSRARAPRRFARLAGTRVTAFRGDRPSN